MDYSILEEFENELCNYTAASYCVLTDSCTHALELCFRYNNIMGSIFLPSRTYISAVMVLHKLGIEPRFFNYDWDFEYEYGCSKIWDSARGFRENMYRSGHMQCLSFGHTKRLEIGHGGAILLDDQDAYRTLKRMAYDGRDLSIRPWQNQVDWSVGYHYNMRLEDAAKGIEMLKTNKLKSMESQRVEYPDVSKLKIQV